MKLGLGLDLSGQWQRTQGGVFVPSEPALVFLQGFSITANQGTYNFEAQNFGDPAADRVLIAGFYSGTSNAMASNSATIGGVAADRRAFQSATNSKIALYTALVPGGSSGDVVFNSNSGNITHCRLLLWRMVGAADAVPADVATASGTDLTQSLDVPAGGMGIGMAGSVASVGTFSWAGLTLDNNSTIEADPVSGASEDAGMSGGATNLIATNSAPDAADGAVYAVWAPVVP